MYRSCPSTRNNFWYKDQLQWRELHDRDVKWNFEKFLIDGQTGHPFKRYDAKVEPKDIVNDIEQLIKKLE